jgi:hypothetical protein
MEIQISEFMNSGNFTTLHCVGHSLGGALAALIANKYSQNGSPLAVKLYTFGSPRVFYGHGDKLKNVSTFRVFHNADPVPMLGPYPLMHNDGGIGIGSGMAVCNPFAHGMESYLGICKPGTSWSTFQTPHTSATSLIGKSKEFVSAGASWMFRALQHVVTYALAALGISVGIATFTAVDILYKLLREGMSKLSTWIIALLRGMAQFVSNGWESAKAKGNDTYYKSKSVIEYIISQFMMKMNGLATSALKIAKPMAGSAASSVKALKGAGLTLPSVFL